ncbi:MAG: hypothetical protein Q4D41_12230 [Prevotellaceae bacterium]|nr:hypothetical protein [Prevotellaceae bacterium]
MEALIFLFVGYAISRAFAEDDNKKKNCSKRRNTSFWDDSSYSAYDTWRKSHGDKNSLF